MQDVDAGPYEILVHGDLVQTLETREQVIARKDFLRRLYRHLHVAVRDRLGISTELEFFGSTAHRAS